jgi:NAD(P)-dependent dehydrogenase (short-subunit alcohol dehydrogenase family)
LPFCAEIFSDAYSCATNRKTTSFGASAESTMDRLRNKTALITGGASGIGRATALAFVEEGARVLIVDRDGSALEQVVREANYGEMLSYCADLLDASQIKAYSHYADVHLGPLDIAVFNAGICGANMPLEEYPEALFDEVMGVNVKAAWLGLRAVVPGMKQRQRGSIIFTSSIQGLAALPGTTAYTTSKHALVGMMKGAALELAPYNVRVNTIHPGYVATPMMDRIHNMVMPDAPEQFQAAIAGTVPMQRYATAEEIARLLVFLASDEGSYSTGGCYPADGGILAALP